MRDRLRFEVAKDAISSSRQPAIVVPDGVLGVSPGPEARPSRDQGEHGPNRTFAKVEVKQVFPGLKRFFIGDRPDPGSTFDFGIDSLFVFLVGTVKDAGVDYGLLWNGFLFYHILGDLNIVFVELGYFCCTVHAGPDNGRVLRPEAICHVNHSTPAPDVCEWGDAKPTLRIGNEFGGGRLGGSEPFFDVLGG